MPPTKPGCLDDWFPEPNNLINQGYYESELDFDMKGDPFVLSILTQGFHEHMVKRQHEAIKSCRFKKRGAVAELMAGCGRNYKMLKEHFSRVEMLERNESMVESI